MVTLTTRSGTNYELVERDGNRYVSSSLDGETREYKVLGFYDPTKLNIERDAEGSIVILKELSPHLQSKPRVGSKLVAKLEA
ncbi:MAG: hypothetical protein AABY10_00040 [Nanoarchaeota archaeon]